MVVINSLVFYKDDNPECDAVLDPKSFPPNWTYAEKTDNITVLDDSSVQVLNVKESPGWIRTKKPIPMSKQPLYFEIMVLDSRDNLCVMEFGLTSKEVSSKRNSKTTVNNVPEMFKDGAGFRNFLYAFGYSSKGGIYGSDIVETYNERQSYSVGDRVGCYLDRENGVCYFIKNGIAQNPVIHLSKLDEPLFPTILFHSCGTKINSFFDERKIDFESQGIKIIKTRAHLGSIYTSRCYVCYLNVYILKPWLVLKSMIGVR